MATRPGQSGETEVVCPNCGNRFPLEASMVDHLQASWESVALARLKREVRAELNPEIEKLAQKQADKLAAKQVRESQEELSEQRKQVAALKRQVTALQKKLPSGREQELGVVRQQTLADILEARFRSDRVTIVARGVAGADVLQVVCNGAGRECGSILWESKRSANWQKAWLQKLKHDQRAGKHDQAVIVSDVLPDSDKSLLQIDGVWVATIDVAGDLAAILRHAVIEVAAARGTAALRDDLKGRVYDYLASSEFVDRIVSIVETAKGMRQDLDLERRALQTRWTARERQIESVVMDIAQVVGDLRGIGAALPKVVALELPA